MVSVAIVIILSRTAGSNGFKNTKGDIFDVMGPARFLIILLIVLVLACPVVVSEPYPRPDEIPEEPQEDPWCIDPDDDYSQVSENGTEGRLWISMAISPDTHWYENETVQVGVQSQAWTDEPMDNDSVEIFIGVGELAEPDCSRTIYINSTITDDPYFYAEALSSFALREGPALLHAQVMFRNQTLNVSGEITVRPPRVCIKPEIIEPRGATYQELNWTPTTLMLFNHGGLGVTNLVVDVRYAGHVVDTFQVPYIPPFGNYSLQFTLLPLVGTTVVDMVPLNGPGANSPLWPGAEIWVQNRTILDVVSLTATPETLESGEDVHIEALVRNRGNATSTGQLVELMVGGSAVANGSIEGLEPGAERVVSTDWKLTGAGTHTISARAEGDDFAPVPVGVEVVPATPATGMALTLVALVLAGVTRAARRW